MNDFNDREDTFVFKPEREEKPHQNRTENDEYSSARSVRYKKPEVEKTSPLVYVAIALAVILIITIIAGIFVLKAGENNDDFVNPSDGVIENEEILEEEEEENLETKYALVFDPQRVFIKENGNGYAVFTDLYDLKGEKVETRTIYITEETEIRDNGMRISPDVFVIVIENQGGDRIMFDAVVREEDNTALSITYDSRGFAEEIPEEVTPEEVPPQENLPEEVTPEEVPSEENVTEEDSQGTAGEIQ